MGDTGVQEFMPILSAGKHRTPRKGACFMEMASYLAGERWSDDPVCTHPLLSSLCRLVNDHTTDQGRSGLAELIPSVIGLNGDGVRWYAHIARSAASVALPDVAAERQNALAVGLMTTEQVLSELDQLPGGSFSPETQQALDRAPHAAAWARRFWVGSKVSPKIYIRRSAPAMVRLSVHGVINSTVPEPDARLRVMLEEALAVCQQLVPGASHFEPKRIDFGRKLKVLP